MEQNCLKLAKTNRNWSIFLKTDKLSSCSQNFQNKAEILHGLKITDGACKCTCLLNLVLLLFVIVKENFFEDTCAMFPIRYPIILLVYDI